MNTKLRVLGVFASLSVVLAACSSTGATPTPAASSGGGASAAPTTAGSGEASAAPSAAALTGTLTIWEAYGASGSSEKTAFVAPRALNAPIF